ncbi:MAG: HAMP domain-containing sensor histidine kinase [Solirubrobacterales bacterium]
MSLRARISLAAAAAVAVAIVGASIAVHTIVRSELRGQIDDSLQSRATVARAFAIERLAQFPDIRQLPPPPFGEAPGVAQVIRADTDESFPLRGSPRLPTDPRAREVALGRRGALWRDVTVDGTHLRVLTVSLANGVAIEVGRPLTAVDRTMRHLTTALSIVALVGIGLALLLGWLVSRAALVPVRRLTETTERVTVTHDLGQRIAEPGGDELGRLAHSFNEMLSELDDSVRSQRRLVADASHELRTPLTSLRTNIEVLQRSRDIPPAERKRLLSDMLDQQTQLTGLVTDLIDLARGDEHTDQLEDIRFDELVRDAVRRAHAHAPEVRFETDLEPYVAHADRARLDRAVTNLLDNAAKWTADGAPIEVSVRDGTLVVRDHGPGFEEQDLPHVFDRFYRSSAARRMPGSGLGLAIVRQVAESQGGSVSAENAPGGGALLRWTFASA